MPQEHHREERIDEETHMRIRPVVGRDCWSPSAMNLVVDLTNLESLVVRKGGETTRDQKRQSRAGDGRRARAHIQVKEALDMSLVE